MALRVRVNLRVCLPELASAAPAALAFGHSSFPPASRRPESPAHLRKSSVIFTAAPPLGAGEDEIENGLGVLEGLVEFLARGIRVGEIIRVTKFPCVRRERYGQFHHLVEAGLVTCGLNREPADVVGFLG